MGLKDKFRGVMEKAIEKMDEIAESDTGALKHEWPEGQPWAVLVESEWHPGSRAHSDSNGADVANLAIEKLTGIPYRFVLDVRRPGFEPYRIEQNVRVPSKVQTSLTQGEVRVPRGAEVPLTVTGPGPADVEIDWDGYLALPGRKQQAERLRAEAQWDRMGADFEKRTKPAQVQKIRSEHRTAVHLWADAVLMGTMTREAFDHESEMAIRMGFLLPADHAEARAKLEG